MNVYHNPVRTWQGPGSLGELGAIMRGALPGGGRALLVTWNARAMENESLRRLPEFGHGLKIRVEDFPHSNPEPAQLLAIYMKTRDWRPDLVVAIGGGSVLDAGKTLCCLYSEKIDSADAFRAWVAEKRFTPSCPWIGVPTTAGTGSEATCWATVWDSEREMKHSIESRDNYAYAAVVDPELARSLPLTVAVSSALDAMAHAVESYWAKASNAVSRGLALEAIRLVAGHIDELIDGPDRDGARDKVSRGSMLAGLAFSNTRTTAGHSISYPLTLRHRIPHGAAVGLLLAPVFRLNADSFYGRAALFEALGVEDADALGAKVDRICKRVGIGRTLRDWGVRAEDLSLLAERGMTKGRADNNPVELSGESVLEALKSIF